MKPLMRALICLLFTEFGITTVPAVVIDNFIPGPLSLHVTNLTGQTILQSGLNPAAVLGGSRRVYAGTLGAAAMEIGNPATSFFHFSADSDFVYFDLRYGSDSALDANLSINGANRFLLDIASLPR